ncbi:hypothetical protein [Streptomyces sp. NPDC047079]|uniref:hypothetical protein n=1 Tax=Streptomyces sp. NPDC047079 TaxID=3154607 RepID=UPI0033C61416
MKKLTQRIATAGISCVIAAGALFATGGAAAAASPQAGGHTSAPTTTADTGHRSSQLRTDHRPTDRWIADQLALFDSAAAKRPTAPDPWIADQLALFAPAAR